MYQLPQRQVHLDFHTSGCIDGIGSMFNKEQFQNCLKKGHVNSITIFAKCHHGWGYFDSRTIPQHPGMQGDLLSGMLEACAEIGVAAPIYISAGLDENYAVHHPEHLRLATRDRVTPPVLEKDGVKYFDGEAHYHNICMNTPYLDLLVSQVEETVQKFQPCGIFLDIVSPRVCYCDYCKQTVKELGWDDSDESYIKLSEITYKKYYEAINEAATKWKKDVRIFHNGGHIRCGRRDLAHANTHLELESLPTGGWGYDHFPKSAKYVNSLGMEYLGMTGKFHLSWGEFGGFKHPNALRYEVALSLAYGAKCSIGDQMHPYGFLDDATYELIGAAYAEAEQVEEYCYDAEGLADIGIIAMEGVADAESRSLSQDVGVCRMLLEGKYLYDMLDPECDFSRYKLLILPDTIAIKGELGEKIKQYVANGGKVLCTGQSGLDENGEMAFDLGIKYLGASAYNPTYYHPSYNALGLTPANYIMYSPLYDVELADPQAQVLGHSRITFFNRTPEHFCSHRHTPFVAEDHAPAVVIGKEGAYIAWDIFSEYAEVGSIILKDTVHRVLDALLGDEKTLITTLPSGGVATVNDQKEQNRLVLHALYAIPTKRGKGVEIIEDLMPVYATEYSVKTDKEIKKVTLVPQNQEIPFTYENGRCKFAIDQFTCKQVIALSYA